MRLHKRILSLLLSAALLLPALPPARAAEGETGSVSATLRVDYPQSLEALRDRSVQAELFQGRRSLGTLDLTREDETDLDGFPAAVTLRNQDGGELGGGNWPGFLDLSVSGLPQGAYTLEFTGVGFVPFRQDVILEDCSQHITLGTSDATFTLGDVNGDGRITKADRELVADALGSESRRDLLQYDLNGDGAIDIYDLAYASRNLNAQGDSQVRDTALLAPPVLQALPVLRAPLVLPVPPDLPVLQVLRALLVLRVPPVPLVLPDLSALPVPQVLRALPVLRAPPVPLVLPALLALPAPQVLRALPVRWVPLALPALRVPPEPQVLKAPQVLLALPVPRVLSAPPALPVLPSPLAPRWRMRIRALERRSSWTKSMSCWPL